MIVKIFSVYDSKAQMFGVPFFMLSVGAAVRAFSDLANDPNTSINKHPTDYVLYEIGTFDDSVGSLVSESPHVNLGNGGNFLVARAPVPPLTSAEIDYLTKASGSK